MNLPKIEIILEKAPRGIAPVSLKSIVDINPSTPTQKTIKTKTAAP
jgi:hypothetical protein